MNRTEERFRERGVWKRLLSVPRNVFSYWSGKAAGWWQSEQLSQGAQTLIIDRAEVKRLRQALSRLETAGTPPRMTAEERLLTEAIREETRRMNRNNVTRTTAYLRLFERTPELHWAFLAHMVSRNGGWNMTDLKGELVSRLVGESAAEALFDFLETSNSYIFHDAYPQLRLFEKSKEHGRSLFHLLPAFGVSSFMRPVWEQFWRERRPALLTVGLIVNEQHYIEKRIVQNETFKIAVLDTPAFWTHSLLQLNAVVFPYAKKESPPKPSGGPEQAGADDYRLAGLVIESFSNLRERIEFGQKLYAVLFGVPAVLTQARLFAARHPHTGSRADYWPSVFAPVRHTPPQTAYKEKLDGGKLLPDASPLYSPKLEQAWKDVPLADPERGDWHRLGASPLRYFETMRPPLSFEMTNEYEFILNKLELAVMAGSLLTD
ncbi:DUF2515 family protein [Paenibacillus ginsengarvi]|uniref:DUF2515 domain-containing protein n=1 Tax=Paenibacillus ginsengarvi TaxID=400777 RepID=A0A3B0CCM5_9BACL|nr:DUF2515 family protein [Paenibacillus ginsengarvi]RKN80686.1 DUF2515 domain-containing protein [Paenibacillus ginsengarvi]